MTEENPIVPQVGDEAHDTILKQVEFYFSDQNLPKDKFLYKTTQQNDGWVPISTIAQFKRMRSFRPLNQIVSALKKSPELLQVSEDGESVRRKLPLVEPKKEDKINSFARSIYAKGFPDENDDSQLEIEQYFTKYGPTKEVRMRRTEDKKFKNSVFVEFAHMEDVEKFLVADPKPKFGETELLTMSKKAYVDMKAAEHGFTQNANGKRKRFNAFNEKKGSGDKKSRYSKNSRFDRGNRGDRDNRGNRGDKEEKPEGAKEEATKDEAPKEVAKDEAPKESAPEAPKECAPEAPKEVTENKD